MMNNRIGARAARNACLVFALALLLAGGFARATDLGDAAPELKISKWVKGEPVDKFEEGKVYVVEFWATWCPPCRTSIPHLTKMQEKFADKVVFIGISDEDEATVEPFVEQMGDQMNYTVALDDNEGTSAGYMAAFKVGGIPHAFVVNGEGKLVWHGHPMDKLDEVLQKVVDGEFDVEAAKKAAEQQKAEQAAMQALIPQLDAYMTAVTADSPDEAEAKKIGAKLVEPLSKIPPVANQLAWLILTDERVKFRDTDLAAKISAAAVEATEGKAPDILDTYARALHDSGKLDEAIAQQKKAIKAAGENEEMKAELTQTLEKYEAEAKEKK